VGIEGWLLNADYVTDGERATVRLWCASPDGEHFVVYDSSFEPYFYVLPQKTFSNCVEAVPTHRSPRYVRSGLTAGTWARRCAPCE